MLGLRQELSLFERFCSPLLNVLEWLRRGTLTLHNYAFIIPPVMAVIWTIQLFHLFLWQPWWLVFPLMLATVEAWWGTKHLNGTYISKCLVHIHLLYLHAYSPVWMCLCSRMFVYTYPSTHTGWIFVGDCWLVLCWFVTCIVYVWFPHLTAVFNLSTKIVWCYSDALGISKTRIDDWNATVPHFPHKKCLLF